MTDEPRRAMHRRRHAASLRIAALLIATSAIAAFLASGCGSGSGQAHSAISSTCTKVNALLSEGPDPQADPVGYAEAQIRPLRQLRSSDPALRTAISELASAYASLFASNGAPAAASAVAAASHRIDAICPGVTS